MINQLDEYFILSIRDRLSFNTDLTHRTTVGLIWWKLHEIVIPMRDVIHDSLN